MTVLLDATIGFGTLAMFKYVQSPTALQMCGEMMNTHLLLRLRLFLNKIQRKVA